MDATTDLDRICAWVEGRLPPEALAALEHELATRPELAELAERFRDVHGLTSQEPEIPACRVSFADLERRLASERGAPLWPRRAAAAALLIAAGVTAGYVARVVNRSDGTETPSELPPAGPPCVVLQSITLEPTVPLAVEEKRVLVPETLASFDPRGQQGVNWLKSWPEALLLSRLSHRPLLVMGTWPGCPFIAKLKAEVYTAPEVLGLIDRYVPVEWDLSTLPPSEAEQLTRYRGYPLLEVWTGDDKAVLNFSGTPELHAFEESMHQGLERADSTGEVPPWDEVREQARRLRAAQEAEARGRLAEAQQELRILARRDAGGPFAEAATAELRRIASGARESLLAARAAAELDPARARALLAEAVLRYAGSGFEVDLQAVLESLDREGRFPELVEAGSDS